MTRQVCVCIPARNEADHIATLLRALGQQSVAEPFVVALCINNSDDGTAEVARAAAGPAQGRYALEIMECQFAPNDAHAGTARRTAMDLGARLLAGDDALLISTDADCRPPEKWLAANLEHSAPDHIIGGRIDIDEEDPAATPAMMEMRRRFDAYWHAVRAIEDHIDPLPWNPAPRHGDHTGASLALTVGLYRRAGGVPPLPVGEDGALVRAAIAAGGRLLHPPAIWTRASPRTVGRAQDGMAQALLHWTEALARGESPAVPDFRHWQERARWRREQRPHLGTLLHEAEQRLPPLPCDIPLPGLEVG
ncbi:glycosyltransferase [uncultured Sphingomonas sp.]|jgi:hypothetical protein|uniref:glycosyltransferase n=1 Tax=uncultured Sphingomonas sp. TaxID=158754 RepID=UPI0030DAECDC